jgi:hypothetical protein
MSKLADEWDRGHVPYVFAEQGAHADEETKEHIRALAYDCGVITQSLRKGLNPYAWNVLSVRVDENYTNMIRVESPAGRMYLLEISPLNY